MTAGWPAKEGAELGAFGVDSEDMERKGSGENLKDGAGANDGEMGRDGGDGGAQGDFLQKWISRKRWKVGHGCVGGGWAGADRNRLEG